LNNNHSLTQTFCLIFNWLNKMWFLLFFIHFNKWIILSHFPIHTIITCFNICQSLFVNIMIVKQIILYDTKLTKNIILQDLTENRGHHLISYDLYRWITLSIIVFFKLNSVQYTNNTTKQLQIAVIINVFIFFFFFFRLHWLDTTD
jgi:hypothetical protein